MWKYEIDAATMDVEGFSQMLPGHCRAFDVPARSARRLDARGRWPGWLTRTGGLPQHKVHRIFFERCNFDAGARDHLVKGPIGEPAVVLHRSDVEQDMILCH